MRKKRQKNSAIVGLAFAITIDAQEEVISIATNWQSWSLKGTYLHCMLCYMKGSVQVDDPIPKGRDELIIIRKQGN